VDEDFSHIYEHVLNADLSSMIECMIQVMNKPHQRSGKVGQGKQNSVLSSPEWTS